MKDCVIIGAGVGGLSLAHALNQAGARVTVIESRSEAGGNLQTVSKDGYQIEQGPNSCLARPALLEFLDEIGLSDQVLFPQKEAANRFLVTRKDGSPELTPVPHGPLEALRTPILSTGAKFRLLREPLVRSGELEDESVADFIDRRFGEELRLNVVSAMLGGIWAADIEKLSARSALSALWEMEHSRGSLTRGAMQRYFSKKSTENKARPTLISFKNGMQQLSDQLASQLEPGSLLLNAEATHLGAVEGGVNVYYRATGSRAIPTRVFAKEVIITSPAKATASMIAEMAPTLATKISETPYAPLGVVHLAFAKEEVEHALNGFGFLNPPSKESSLLGAIFSSSLFEGRAPKDKHLLTCFMGGSRRPEMADATSGVVQQQAIAEVSELIGTTATPEIIETAYWPQAIPNYPLGHFKTQLAVDDFHQKHPNVHLLANWDRGISVPDRIRMARELARDLVEANPEFFRLPLLVNE